MKFQNPSIHGSKVNRRTDRQTDRQTDKPKAICPSNFFKVGGIKMNRNKTVGGVAHTRYPLSIHFIKN